jgi:NAD(P)-dependent dehydrogenase (short-subunit alcohol dehydrogenase family)
MKKLQDKVAIITGAASGIGLASARVFAEEGAAVVIADLDAEQGTAAAQEITDNGGRALFVQTDVSQEHQVEALIQRTLDHFGDLDIMFNNAGMEELYHIHELSTESWQRQIDVNLKGTFLGCKHAIRHFLKKGRGVILNTSSIGGILPTPQRPAYNSAKAGVILLTKNIALEYGKRNIRANVICPGIVYTKMTALLRERPDLEELARKLSALHRVARPEEIARAALFLVCDDASFITGISLIVDGGMSLRAAVSADSDDVN